MVPTLAATLGVKGHRPTVGTRDCKDLLYVFAVVNLVSAAIHANTLESPKDAKKKTGIPNATPRKDDFASVTVSMTSSSTSAFSLRPFANSA